MGKIRHIYFRDSDHSYVDGDGKRLESVSGTYKKVQPPFDSYRKSMQMAYSKIIGAEAKNLLWAVRGDLVSFLKKAEKKWGQPREVIEYSENLRSQWKSKGLKSTTFGTKIHKIKELEDIDNGYSVHPITGEKFYIPDIYYTEREKWLEEGWDNRTILEDLSKLPDGYYPEFLTHYKDTAGQSDKVYIETVGKTRYIDFDDWKTDNEIKIHGFYDHIKQEYGKLSYPLNYLHNCNYITYQIKISMYSWMTAKFGYKPRHTMFTHLICDKDKESIINSKLYTFKYRKEECDLIFKGI